PQLLQPSRDVLVCLVLADVVDKEGADSSSVVGGGNGAVSLLAGGIPNLCLDRLGVDLNGSGSELDADCRLGVQVELIAGESTEKVGLSDAGVSNQDH
ncbi:Ras-like protein Rab-11B, partial [Colletotrichum asianum]